MPLKYLAPDGDDDWWPQQTAGVLAEMPSALSIVTADRIGTLARTVRQITGRGRLIAAVAGSSGQVAVDRLHPALKDRAATIAT